jgi:hypothetical protein
VHILILKYVGVALFTGHEGPKGAHTRTSLASESGWARVPVSQTRPCVECHEPSFARLYIYTYTHIHMYIRAWLPNQAPRGGLANQTHFCMGTLRENRGIVPLCFHTSVLEGGEGSASRPGRFLPPGKTRYPLSRRLGGPQGRSGQVRKISPHRGSIPGPSSP